MKFLKITIYILAITVTLAIAVDSARAQINPMLSFTGKITETDGSELADGVYDMSFRLYGAATGGVSLWSEDLIAANCFSGSISAVGSSTDGIVYTYMGGSASSTLRSGQYLSSDSSSIGVLIVDFNHSLSAITVASSSEIWPAGAVINNRPFVEGGVINVGLGSVSGLASVDFNQPLYLEVVFNSETMQPRKLYNSAASAFNADKLDGYDSSDFANLSADAIISGEWSFEEILSIATSSSVAALTVAQNGSGNIVEFKSGTSTYLSVLNDGRIQIGDYTLPADRTGASSGYVLKLGVSGDMYWDPDFAGGFGLDGKTLWATNTESTLIYPIDTSYVTVIGGNASSTLDNQIFEVNGFALFDTINISNQEQLRFYDSDSSNYMAIRASGTLASDFILTLPVDAGIYGQALITDGSGNLRWSAPTSFVYVNPGVTGQISYYAEDGSTLSATSSIFISPAGYFGIGTASPAALLSIGANTGSQLLINENGEVISGTWQADIVSSLFGGTGKSSWQSGSIVFATSSNVIDELLIGAEGRILQAVNGKPEWVATSSLGIDFNSVGGTLGADSGGTGADSSGWNGMVQVVSGNWSAINGVANHVAYWTDANTIGSEAQLGLSRGGTGANMNSEVGFLYFDNGTAIASNTIATVRTDLIDNNSGVELTGNVLSLNTSGNWIGTFDGYEAGELFVLSDWYATTTDALSQGLTNLYWSDSRFDNQFDARLLATTSISGIIELPNLSFVGVIATGTWAADTIGVSHGGTGFDSISSQSLVFASSDDTLAGLAIGGNGEVLIVSGGNLTWASTSPASQHGILSVTHGDVDATSTLERGDLMVVNSDSKWSRLELGPAGYILYSDGADMSWATTTSIIALGEIVQGSWKASPIDIAYGGTGGTTATSARANLDLDEVYKFGITSTGTDGYVWQSDGDGQGDWVATSSLGLGGTAQTYSKFIGTTTAVTDGYISTSSLSGYAAANAMCDYEFSGSYFCRTYDILVSIEQDDISAWGTASPDAWIAEGPPGYTANSNDCNGWNTNGIDYLGAFWVFNGNTGGYGKLVNCTQFKPLACCARQ